MDAYIITIGDELLNGNTIDTNSVWLGKELEKIHIRIKEKITVSDNKDTIVQSIQRVINRKFPYIFVTGGLGPTHDDITKSAIKEILKSNEYFDEVYYKELQIKFKKRNIKISRSNRSQAMMLSKCNPIENPIGTALGMEFFSNKSRVFVMPGVPIEMRKMIKEVIFPRYFQNNVMSETSITILTAGTPESLIADKIQDFVEEYREEIKIAFLPQYSGVNIRLNTINNNFDKMIELKEKINLRLGKIIYGYNEDKIEDVVGDLLLGKKMTISIAESCTGGLLSKKITNTPGSSKYYNGGIIAYQNLIKEKKLNVSKEILDSFGAVSQEVVTEMALGIKKEFLSNIGFAISGISGPEGGNKNKEVGLVHMALACGETIIHKRFNFIPDRNLHREISANTALNIIRLFLRGNKNEF